MNDKVTISVAGTFTAAELEEVIRDLAETRAGMTPPVPSTPEAAGTALVQADSSVKVRSLVDGGVRVWIRNEGIGWIALTVSAEKREGLANFLAGKGGDTHTLH